MTWQQIIMYLVGIGLIYLGIKKKLEPALLIPLGFGAILVIQDRLLLLPIPTLP